MERYKEELNNIHAPEALIMKTLARVHEEEKKVEAEKAENNITNNSTNNVTNIFETRSNFQKLEDEFGGETNYKPESTAFKKFKTFAKVGGTVAAAAVVILLAMGAANLNHTMNESSAPTSDTSYSEAEEATEASYEEADDSDEESEEESYDGVMGETAAMEAEDSNASSGASSASNSSDDGEDIFYNDIAEYRRETKNAISKNDAKSESIQMAETADSSVSDEISAGEESTTLNIDAKLNEIDIAEYNDYLGIEINDYLDKIPVDEFTAYAEYEGDIIVDDIGSAVLTVAEGNGMFIVSKARMLGPETLRSGTASVIGNTNVYVGRLGENLYAVFTINGVNYYLKTNGDTQADFESILRSILE